MIRVFIIGQVRLYTEGLEQALGYMKTIQVQGREAHLTAAVSRILELKPHIVLLDSPIPEGPDAVRQLLKAAPETKVIALAVREVEEEIIAWAEAGIAGYVGTEASLNDLLANLESVSRGGMLCSPEATAVLIKRVATLAARGWTHSAPYLTPRQKEIAILINRGLSNKEIARTLSIALPTVKNHIHSILGKLQVRRRADVAFATGVRKRQLVRTSAVEN